MNQAVMTLAALALAVAAPSQAEVRTPVKVRYATQEGMSRYVETDVTYMTGRELNTRTTTFDYDVFGTYAVIFFSPDQAAVIKLAGFFTCGQEATASCVSNRFGNDKGTDQRGREWELCSGSFC